MTLVELIRFADIDHDCVLLVDELRQLNRAYLIGAAATSAD